MSYWLTYQKEWLRDKSQIKIWEKSRRIGATYVQSFEDVQDCLTQSVESVWFSSADITAAKEYIQYIEKWASVYNIAFKALGEVVVDPDKDVKALCVEFSNGTRIHALSSNPTQFRSKGGKIVLDEFAWHNDPVELWRAAYPCITWGFPVRILSTHNGQENLFFKFTEEIKAGKKTWSIHNVTIHDAVEQGLLEKITKKNTITIKERQDWLDDLKNNCVDDLTWYQEFCCIPYANPEAKIVYAWDEKYIREVPYVPELDLHISCDFNRAPNCWILAHKSKEKIFFFDEFCLDLPTEELICVVLDKYPHPSRVIINGDASGNSECSKSKWTDYKLINNELLKRGYREYSARNTDRKVFKFEVQKANGSRKARFTAWNRKMKEGSIIISPKCSHMIYNCKHLKSIVGTSNYDLPTVKQIEKNNALKYLGHAFDDGSYAVNYYWPIEKKYIKEQIKKESILKKFRNS